MKFCDLRYFSIVLLRQLLQNPEENSQIQNKTKLNKRTIEKLVNKVFVLDNQDKNEEIIRQYTSGKDITVT